MSAPDPHHDAWVRGARVASEWSAHRIAELERQVEDARWHARSAEETAADAHRTMLAMARTFAETITRHTREDPT